MAASLEAAMALAVTRANCGGRLRDPYLLARRQPCWKYLSALIWKTSLKRDDSIRMILMVNNNGIVYIPLSPPAYTLQNISRASCEVFFSAPNFLSALA
jgi:hypothetical protein